MVASTVVPLRPKSQAAFIAYYKSVQQLQNITRDSSRARLERIDREYQRVTDLSDTQRRAKTANRQGDTTRYQNMTVPVVMPQVESAVVHQTSVYLTEGSIFGVVSSPQFIDEALMMESKIDDDAVRNGWARELIMFFRDGFKYNFAPLEVSWEREVTYTIETDIAISTKEGVPKETIWTGNRLKRLDPYNTFVDTRVPPSEVHKRGEFAGYTEFMSRIELKSFVAALPDKIIANIVPAFESGLGSGGGATDAGAINYYTPSINPDIIEPKKQTAVGTDWFAWADIAGVDRKIDYKDGYEVTRLYCKVLPSEFDLKVSGSNTPQIYKLIIINHEHIIYAELQTNAHNYLPILIGQPKEDGLGYQTKSLADNGAPFQELATTYMTSILESRRRAIADRLLYDPSRVTRANINSPNPSAKIPVRPSAQGKDLKSAVYHFPYNEDQISNSMQQISVIMGLANNLAGQNQVSQGQFQKGNKTLGEFENVMENANGNDMLASILLEFQVFIPLKHILKINILQFQGGTTVYNRDKNITVEIDPVKLRKAVLEFRVSDGLLPKEKLINSESLANGLQAMSNSPQIGASYNIGPLFSYLMKTQGAQISEFEKSQEQVTYEQALNTWQGLVQLAIEKGIDPEKLGIGERPLPKDFNYDPAKNEPAPETTTANATSEGTPTVNTSNI